MGHCGLRRPTPWTIAELRPPWNYKIYNAHTNNIIHVCTILSCAIVGDIIIFRVYRHGGASPNRLTRTTRPPVDTASPTPCGFSALSRCHQSRDVRATRRPHARRYLHASSSVPSRVKLDDIYYMILSLINVLESAPETTTTVFIFYT